MKEFFSFLFTTNLKIFLIIIIYCIIILYFFYYIFYLQNKNNNKNINYNSIIKDKEFILFKINLFKFYYSTIIILFYFLFKQNYFSLLLEFNTFAILFLFIILFFYSILYSTFLNIKLFNLYLEIKRIINLLNNINFVTSSLNYNSYKNNIIYNFNFNQSRNFSSYISEQSVNETDDNIFNLNENLAAPLDNTEIYETEISAIKEKAIKDFKKYMEEVI